MTTAAKTMFLTNAFSLNMLADPEGANIKVESLDMEDMGFLANKLTSAIGHQDTANVLSNILNTEIPVNRVNVTLEKGDKVIVAQFHGARLPEGATTLPEGATIRFWVVGLV